MGVLLAVRITAKNDSYSSSVSSVGIVKCSVQIAVKKYYIGSASYAKTARIVLSSRKE